ncbi:hypothetical protein V6N12_065356 [Hibiscus sabdariffa]|uniref:Uncharacterized protein n=1 Tax=Hibiscus sabdariffa TaxID=183260 RepID=A0ABR2G8H1_9ROSI
MHSCLICPPSPIYYYCCICVKSGTLPTQEEVDDIPGTPTKEQEEVKDEDIPSTAPTQEQEDVRMVSCRYSKNASNTRAVGDIPEQTTFSAFRTRLSYIEDISGTLPTQEEDVGMMSSRIKQISYTEDITGTAPTQEQEDVGMKIFQKLFQHKRRCGDDEQQDHAAQGTPSENEHDHEGALAHNFFLYITLDYVFFSHKVFVYRIYSRYNSNKRARECGDDEQQDHAEDTSGTLPTQEHVDDISGMPTQEQDDVRDDGLQQDQKTFIYIRYFRKSFNTRDMGDDEQQDHVEDIRGTAPTQEQEDVGMMSNRIMQL